MDALIQFLSLQDPNVRYVVLGMIMLGIGSALVGTFAFLQKRSLTGDAIAHAVLPGICLAFMLFESRNLWLLMCGAFATGWLSIFSVDIIVARTKLKADTAIGLTLSVFFGVGIVLLTFIQQRGDAAQSGLNNFLFGKAAAMQPEDILTMSIVCAVIIAVIAMHYQSFRILSFDPLFAESAGLPVKKLRFLLTTITVLAVAAGIQAVGVVLMSALLITPASAARYWTNRLGRMIIIAIVVAVTGSIAGAFISYTENKMPTGPWIVVVISVIALLSILLAPGRGIVWRWWRRIQYLRKSLRENILKEAYHLHEKNPDKHYFTKSDIQEERRMQQRSLDRGINMLLRRKMLAVAAGNFILTESGMREGRRITRIHRLWELYLTEKLQLQGDHVHEDAEGIEHIITPEMEDRLIELLQRPEKDPHEKTIPYN